MTNPVEQAATTERSIFGTWVRARIRKARSAFVRDTKSLAFDLKASEEHVDEAVHRFKHKDKVSIIPITQYSPSEFSKDRLEALIRDFINIVWPKEDGLTLIVQENLQLVDVGNNNQYSNPVAFGIAEAAHKVSSDDTRSDIGVSGSEIIQMCVKTMKKGDKGLFLGHWNKGDIFHAFVFEVV